MSERDRVDAYMEAAEPWAELMIAARYEEAAVLLETTLAKPAPADTVFKMWIHHSLGATYMCLGRWEQAQAHFLLAAAQVKKGERRSFMRWMERSFERFRGRFGNTPEHEGEIATILAAVEQSLWA